MRTQQELDRELGLVRGLHLAQKLALARGYYDFVEQLGDLACSPSDTFILANTSGGITSETCTAQSHAPLTQRLD
jgi:hypothetical protein